MELHFESNEVIKLIKNRITFCKEELKAMQEYQEKWLKENERYALFIFDRFKTDALKNKSNQSYNVDERVEYYQKMLPNPCPIKKVEDLTYFEYSFPRYLDNFVDTKNSPTNFKWKTVDEFIGDKKVGKTDIYFKMKLPARDLYHPWLKQLERKLLSIPTDISITISQEEYDFIKESGEGYFNLSYLDQDPSFYKFGWY